MGLCESTKLLGCAVFSLSGLLIVATIALEPGQVASLRLLGLALATMSYSVMMLMLDKSLGLIVTAAFSASIILGLVGPLAELGFLQAPVLVSIPLALIASLANIGLAGPSLTMLSGLMVYSTPWLDPDTARMALAVSCIVLGASSIKVTGRTHSSLLAAAALPMALAPYNWVAWLASAITGVSVMVSQAGVGRVSRCPFRTDSSLVFFGTVFSVGSIASLIALGVSALPYSMWVLGVILLMAGSLVPQKP